MDNVKPKKHLGQHFLKDKNIAAKIVASLSDNTNYDSIIEVGPGMGVLTDFLIKCENKSLYLIEIDKESVLYLNEKYKNEKLSIWEKDFLSLNLSQVFETPIAIIGNFPYNISSQILFKIIEHREIVAEAVGMFQKEVAERIAAKEGNKTYGILSVLTQAFYQIEYLFTVNENVFLPPPKVKSAVIRLVRKHEKTLACDEVLFVNIVKTAFNQRRKMLRNALQRFGLTPVFPFCEKRAEQLSLSDFIELTQYIQKKGSVENSL